MVILRGDTAIKEVALLFDDGPNPHVTPKLFKVLEEKQVPGNFFLIGMRAEQSPEIVRQIVEAGHEIGNHTYTHKRLVTVLREQGEQAVIDEVMKGKVAIEKISNLRGGQVRFFRPPYLDWSHELGKIVKPIHGDDIMMSGLEVRDWDWGTNHAWNEDDTTSINKQATHIVEGWKQTANNGTLLGFHDSSEHNLPGNKQYDTWMHRALPTLEAIPHIVDFLLDKGFEIKRLSDMRLVKEDYVDLRST